MCIFAAMTVGIIISILFILCLTSSVAPHSVGLVTTDDKPSRRFIIPLMFGISQGLATLIGYNVGRLIAHLYTYIADYMVFIMMIVVAIKMFVESMQMLKGKMLYTVSKEWDFILLSILAAFNTLLMSLMGNYFMPFGLWFIMAMFAAGFLWSFFTVRIEFSPKIIKKVSFVEFSAAVFMVVIAFLFLFTDLI